MGNTAGTHAEFGDVPRAVYGCTSPCDPSAMIVIRFMIRPCP